MKQRNRDTKEVGHKEALMDLVSPHYRLLTVFAWLQHNFSEVHVISTIHMYKLLNFNMDDKDMKVWKLEGPCK